MLFLYISIKFQSAVLLICLATGEPPLLLSLSAVFAMRKALEAARHDAGNDEWPDIGL